MGFSHQRQAAARTVLRARATNNQSAIDDAEEAVTGYIASEDLEDYLAEHFPNGLTQDPPSPVFGKVELDEMHRVATAAFERFTLPWVRINDTDISVIDRDPRDGSIVGGGRVAQANTEEWAEHIVTFEPVTILRLLNAIEVSNRFS